MARELKASAQRRVSVSDKGPTYFTGTSRLFASGRTNQEEIFELFFPHKHFGFGAQINLTVTTRSSP